MKALNIYITIVLLAVFTSAISQDANKKFVRQNSAAGGLNVKFMPAMYWDCLGIEVEMPLSDKITIGVNMLGQAGRTDRGDIVFKIRQEDYQKASYRLEFAAKYFFTTHAPIGMYIQGNFSYGSLEFFDGTNRPYTMHSRWKDFKQGELRSPTDEGDRPLAYSVGIGAGYQMIIIPKKILGNIMIGTQGHLTKDAQVYPALYVAPSLGVMF